MPSYSNVFRFHTFHVSSGSVCVEEPNPNRYIIINSLYKSHRYGRNPNSGVQPCGNRGVSSESHVHSTRSKISDANREISSSLKCALQVRMPQSRMAVSTDETSESSTRSPVSILAQ